MEDATSGELQAALLALGLEDLIPLWEAATAWEVRAAAPATDLVAAIGQALRTLLVGTRIRVYEGYWDAEPTPVPTDRAMELVTDRRWYAYPPEDDRVYFVNVENLPEP